MILTRILKMIMMNYQWKLSNFLVKVIWKISIKKRIKMKNSNTSYPLKTLMTRVILKMDIFKSILMIYTLRNIINPNINWNLIGIFPKLNTKSPHQQKIDPLSCLVWARQQDPPKLTSILLRMRLKNWKWK